MKKVRFGIIGLGNIGKYHAEYLLAEKIRRAELAAVCNRSGTVPEKLRGLKVYSDANQLIRSGDVDAVIIATPHFDHAPLGIAAFENGLHVLVEKPVAAHKADAEKLIAAHKKNSHLVFAAMFQLRAEPRYLTMKKLIAAGELGEIVRLNWINTDWFRTDAYYAGSEWRATWRGEGGGVLLNQCLHNLDALQWLAGMPVRVRGFCQHGRFHPVEVEDNASAYFEWQNRATGVFIGSTGESPGTNRLEICGTRGQLILEKEKLFFRRNAADMVEFSRAARQGFAKLDFSEEEIPFASTAQPHAVLTQNFVDAILDGAPLIAPGADGLNSVELANAIVFSSLLGETLELPLDGAAWEKKLNELAAGSAFPKKTARIAADDFAGSFKK